jgi:hypothetical protein
MIHLKKPKNIKYILKLLVNNVIHWILWFTKKSSAIILKIVVKMWFTFKKN